MPWPLPRLTPLPLERRAEPFDDPGFVFELNFDGFRALAYLERGKVQLVSRRGHVYRSFPALCDELATALRKRARNAILDGELVALDEQGRPGSRCTAIYRHATDREARVVAEKLTGLLPLDVVATPVATLTEHARREVDN